MFPGRIAAITRGMKRKKKGEKVENSKVTKKNNEIEKLKSVNKYDFKDEDLYELNSRRLRFRNYPYAFWFLGTLFLLGSGLIVFLLYEDFI